MSRPRNAYLTPTVLILDFDDVINDSCEPDEVGFIGGDCIEPEAFKDLIDFCIKKNIPCHIVTARADNKLNRAHVTTMIEAISGFQNGIGGFKQENLHFLGIEHIKNQKSTLIALSKTKLAMIDEIAEKEQCPAKMDMLFIDDDLKHLEPVMNAGYSTIQAKPGEKYMSEALTFLHTKLANLHTFTAYKGKMLFPPKMKTSDTPSTMSISTSSSPATSNKKNDPKLKFPHRGNSR